MKIYLLNPPFIKGFSRGVRGVGEATRGGTLYYPIWLSYAASLLETSHEIRLIDAQARGWDVENILNDINCVNPDLIIIDTNFSSLNNDISIANRLKDKSGALTVVVGPPASQFSEKILNDRIDIVVRYEYDLTLKEIADNLENGNSLTDVQGISYKDHNKIITNANRDFTCSDDLDEIPFVSKIYKNHLKMDEYFLSSSLNPMVQIFTGRGCPNQCVFCSWPKTLMGKKYRVRSIDNVLDEFEYIVDELPEIKEIFIEDDTFTVDKKRVLEFCKKYGEREFSIAWACNTRATLDYETMKEMKKANCRLLICGYESGSDEILKNIKKGITVDQIITFARNARKSGILVHGDIIIGLPGETKETIAISEKLLSKVRPDILQVLVPQPIPGTDLYDWCQNNGHLLIDDPNEYLDNCGYQKSVISYPQLSNKELKSEADRILKKYYLSPAYIPIALRQIFRKNGHLEAKRLLYSVKLFINYARG